MPTLSRYVPKFAEAAAAGVFVSGASAVSTLGLPVKSVSVTSSLLFKLAYLFYRYQLLDRGIDLIRDPSAASAKKAWPGWDAA